jgi:NAD(P)-dependent dehydrogenase (short-subunit alcohol dehydrogenase family)
MTMQTAHAGVQLFSLEGKTALVTGATGYLGEAMASALAEAGATVLVNSRSAERAEAMAAGLRARGYLAEAAVFDVTDAEAIRGFFAGLAGRPLHVLINNAYVGGGGSIEVSDAQRYAASYDVTMLAAHNMLTAALPALRQAVQEARSVSVINIASMYAMVSPDQRIYASAAGVNPPFYGAAKAALLHWTRYAACEFGPEGIRVNAISPGPFPAPAVQQGNAAFVATLATKVPLGRVGQAEEIKAPTLFLASPAASFVNGANLVVDGGWTCW